MVISDQVWDRLDPHAGRVSPTTRRRLWIGIVTATAVAAVLVVAGWSGVLVPHLRADGYRYQASASGPDRTLTITVRLQNDGLFGQRISSAGRSGPGLQLVSSRRPDRLEAASGSDLMLTYRVTDCAAVPSGEWPIPVRVHRPWGTVTGWVVGPEMDAAEDADEDAYVPELVGWQQYLADRACSPGTTSISSD